MHMHITPVHIHTPSHIHAHAHDSHTCTPHKHAHTPMHMYMHVYTHHTHVYTFIHTFTCMHTHTHPAPALPCLPGPSLSGFSLSIWPVRHLLSVVTGSLPQLLTWLHQVSVQLLPPQKSLQCKAPPLPPVIVFSLRGHYLPLPQAVGSTEAPLKACPALSMPVLLCPHFLGSELSPGCTYQQVFWESIDA